VIFKGYGRLPDAEQKHLGRKFEKWEEEAEKREKISQRERRRSSGEGRNKGEDRQQQSIQNLIHHKLLNTIEN
jgi:hypothetical protein